MHDGMQYDLIQGQDHEPCVQNLTILASAVPEILLFLTATSSAIYNGS